MTLAELAQTDDKSLATFRASIRAAVRGLWKQQIDLLDFIDQMYSAVKRGYEQAWRDGAKECGMKPGDRTPEEQAILDQFILDNQAYVLRFGDWIESNRDKVKIESAFNRAELWANRYGEVKAKAQLEACQNQKYRWALGGTERHCRSCRKLHGRVYRASIWKKYNIAPRDTSGRLECHGYKCLCSFVATDDPVTPGKPPNLP